MYLDAFVNMHMSWNLRCGYKYVYILSGFFFFFAYVSFWFWLFPFIKKEKKDISYIVMNLAEVELL